MLDFIKSNKIWLATILILALALTFAGKNVFCSWYYDKIVIGDAPLETSLKPDTDWLSCIYNCALQVSPQRKGVCAKSCDLKYQKEATHK